MLFGQLFQVTIHDLAPPKVWMEKMAHHILCACRDIHEFLFIRDFRVASVLILAHGLSSQQSGSLVISGMVTVLISNMTVLLLLNFSDALLANSR